ncbi:P-loop containing nucleoside triphosphate hydrolase protein [Hymenopellis radicata]|nr:P-loop containing nucleoside triphosphate hydrolase protein [Hymenopellis radicata]
MDYVFRASSAQDRIKAVDFVLTRFHESIFLDTLAFPMYGVALSVTGLVLCVLMSRFARKGPEDIENRAHPELSGIAPSAGHSIFFFRLLRLAGCIALLGCSIATLVLKPGEAAGLSRLSSHRTLSICMCVTYLYDTALAVATLSAQRDHRAVAKNHLNFLLLVTAGVMSYRDIAPLATFNSFPRDESEGWLLWMKVALLLMTAVIIPLVSPREYVPADPENPSSTPSPEQTASWISLVLFIWMDKVVATAYRVSHLAADALPPLPDTNGAAYLKRVSFKHLDPFSGAKSRHMFFGLLRVAARELPALVSGLFVQLCANFAAPVGINRLLRYIETEGEGAVYRPWVWIVWLVAGPLIADVSHGWFLFIATRIGVRQESIITQLVFEHALRMRVKAEVHNPPDKKKAGGNNTTGKINNLVTGDISNISDAGLRQFSTLVIYTPLAILLSLVFLYNVLGWSALVGVVVIIVMMPLPGFLAKLFGGIEKETMKRTDGRVQAMTEMVNVIRMVKVLGWEREMEQRIAGKREDELHWMKKRRLYTLITSSLNVGLHEKSNSGALIHFAKTIVMKEELSASKVFSSMTIFDLFAYELERLMSMLTAIPKGKVSLDRLTAFLRETELLDRYSKPDDLEAQANSELIGFNQATFSWSETSPSQGSAPAFQLQIDEELVFSKNSVNLIVGPTGSGKTSMLMALLGEMHYTPNTSESWSNLPRIGGVAYAAQESWVLNATVKENILFGASFDNTRYKDVLYQCALDHDLNLFQDGDETEIGEKGLTLSGGQKARVTLARAIYSSAEIILLDDVLAALELGRCISLMRYLLTSLCSVHTAKWIINKCFKGRLVKGRTLIMVTHNLALAQPLADFVVSIKDGRIANQGSLSKALAEDDILAKEAQAQEEKVGVAAQNLNDEHIESIADTKDNAQPSDKSNARGKLIVSEEILTGRLALPAVKLYLSGLGGSYPFLFYTGFVGTFVLRQLTFTVQTWYLGYWASQYETRDAREVPALSFIGIYGLMLLAAYIFAVMSSIIFITGVIRASRIVNNKLVVSILGTTLRWLDTTPVSRIITRCTQDMRAVDGPISVIVDALANVTLTMIIKFGAVVTLSPVFLLPALLVALLGVWIGQIYMKAQLPIKREMSNAKSPILAHFGAAMVGLTSIRAYGAEQAFIGEAIVRQDKYTRTSRSFWNLNRWVDIRINTIGSMFAAGLAIYLVYFHELSASNVGFSLNMAVGFTKLIFLWVRYFNHFEVQGDSLERIQSYLTIEQEKKPTPSGVPPAYWPASGQLTVKDLSARYSPDGPNVLENVTFSINTGERIGIVGRTGSGKSSLALSLLRCIYTEGEVIFDGIPTDTVNLDILRSKITIIPQVPELLSGTLRENLDPFQSHDDATLNDALRASGLFSLQEDTDQVKLTLDSPIASGGGNLSVGQRQVIALARALVRDSKLLILDEATSAIDYKTDAIIQSSLRTALKPDVTLLTIAHRLQTVMDFDKILVLDTGNIVEYDTPRNLLRNPNGYLRALVEESADKAALYAMAK